MGEHGGGGRRQRGVVRGGPLDATGQPRPAAAPPGEGKELREGGKHVQDWAPRALQQEEVWAFAFWV